MIKILCLSLLLLGIFAGGAYGNEHWSQESSGDWLGAGPIYPYGPFYYPMYYGSAYYVGWEDYPIYSPVYYPIYSTYYRPHYNQYYYDDLYYDGFYYNKFFHKDGDQFRLGTFGVRRGGNY